MRAALARRYPEGWLKPCSNVRRRKMIALNDRTRLTVPLNFIFYSGIMSEQITGTVYSVTFRNDTNGYTVLELETGDGDIFTAVGSLPPLVAGERAAFNGSWTVHPSYGRQFKIEGFERLQIKTADEQYGYLASGAIKGIREATARRIVEAFGEETFDVISNDPVRLSSIKGISKERAAEISEEFNKTFAEREIIISLEKYGISAAESVKIYKVLGNKAVEEIERNPYIICEDVVGMSFEKAESVAAGFAEKPDSVYRNTAGVKYVLNHNLFNGHTCVPREKLIEPCMDLLGVDRETVEKAIDTLVEKKGAVAETVRGKPYVFLNEMYKAESDCAKQLTFRKKFSASGNTATDERIQQIEVISGICYNDVQKRAIRTAVEKGLLVLTGGPGTGKTTTIRAIINLFVKDGIETVLCAPTGRAAKRMSELTGYEAKTVHRLLEVEWDKNDKPVFTRNAGNPIDADALIVDEVSMVDVRLFASLLDALPLNCRLVMVGDSDQLPPVGAGNVLHEIFASGIVPVVELNEVFRQALQSSIVVNAHKIVKGEMPDLTVRDSDFFFMERKNPFAAAETVSELCCKRLPGAYGYSPLGDIQVIAPSRIGETGTVNLDKRLQAVLNSPSKSKREFLSAGRVFREGDKIMQTKNNYDIEWESSADGSTGLGIFNGDIGIIKKIDTANAFMNISFDDKDVVYPLENAQQLEHAYAITVHKSQGSEFKAVIVPVCGIPDRLAYRNLLYTAVTRARELLIAVGDENCVRKMAANNTKAKRYSALQDFLVMEKKDELF